MRPFPVKKQNKSAYLKRGNALFGEPYDQKIILPLGAVSKQF